MKKKTEHFILRRMQKKKNDSNVHICNCTANCPKSSINYKRQPHSGELAFREGRKLFHQSETPSRKVTYVVNVCGRS